MSITLNNDTHGSKPRTNSGVRGIIVPAVLMLVGILVLLYPVVSTQYNNIRQHRVVEEYQKIVQDVPVAQRDTLMSAAETYNREHTSGPVLDPWLARVAVENKQYQEYLQVLGNGETSPMSQILIPSINVNLPVYHGSDEFILQHGVGHLFGSSMPIGGDSTHSVLTGHTGLTNATLFDNLVKVKEGDAFYVNTYGRHMKYVVDTIRVVLPEETKGLDVVAGKDLVTLVTCTPYGINTHRLLVTGHRVAMDAAEEKVVADQHSSGLVWQWWMVAILAAAALAFAGLVWWVIRSLRRAKQRNENLTPPA